MRPGEGETDEQFLFRFLNLTKGTEFRVVDKTTKLAVSKPSLGGLVQVSFDPVPSNYWWEIEREVSVVYAGTQPLTVSAAITPLALYVGSADIAGSYRDGSATGQKSVADNASVLRIGPGEVLTAIWANTNVGDIGTLLIQYQVLTKD